MPEYTLSASAATVDEAIAAATVAGKQATPENWSPEVVAAVNAVKALADLTKAPDVEVNVAYSTEGGWAVVRIAPHYSEKA